MTEKKIGRPPKYNSPEEMQEKIDLYFSTLDEEKPTVLGLCIALDLTRQGLLEYADKPLYSDTVKKAKMKVELALEQHLYTGQVAGVIFNLKNNFGWKDQVEKKITGDPDKPVHLIAGEMPAAEAAKVYKDIMD